MDEAAGARLATLLDQKNYVEEINRSLAANVVNLQVRGELAQILVTLDKRRRGKKGTRSES